MTQGFIGQLLHGGDGGLVWSQQESLFSMVLSEAVIVLVPG